MAGTRSDSSAEFLTHVEPHTGGMTLPSSSIGTARLSEVFAEVSGARWQDSGSSPACGSWYHCWHPARQLGRVFPGAAQGCQWSVYDLISTLVLWEKLVWANHFNIPSVRSHSARCYGRTAFAYEKPFLASFRVCFWCLLRKSQPHSACRVSFEAENGKRMLLSRSHRSLITLQVCTSLKPRLEQPHYCDCRRRLAPGTWHQGADPTPVSHP